MSDIAQMMAQLIAQNMRPMEPRPYIGYEDYSPEGRAAIGAFNAAGGPNVLQRQLATSPQYQSAKAAGMRAGGEEMQRQQMRFRGQQGMPPMPTYQYPPKE